MCRLDPPMDARRRLLQPRCSTSFPTRSSALTSSSNSPWIRRSRHRWLLRLGVAGTVGGFGKDCTHPTSDPGNFNNTVAEKQEVLETVSRRVTKKNETKDNKSFPFKEVFLDRSEQEDVPTLIDRKVLAEVLEGQGRKK